jgi:protein phosphatase
VADGMGGHQAGEIAADLAIDHLGDALAAAHSPDGRQLVGAIERANGAIRRAALTRPELLGMGTTCTALVVTDVVTIAHVGDSRAYRLRAARLEQLTDDHSLVAAMVRDGRLDPAAAPTDPRRHVITRALGADDDVNVDLVTVDRQPGDRLLLCSDGIHGQLDDTTIEQVLAGVTDPGGAADRLIELAAAAGGEDNATVIVIDADRVAGPRSADAAVADVAVPDRTRGRRSRRGVLARIVLLLVAVAVIVAAVVWLAGGGQGVSGPTPSVAAPSFPGPSSAGPSTAAPPSAPAPSVAGPSPAAPSPS